MMRRFKTLPAIGVLMTVLALVGCADDGSVTGPLGSIDDPPAQFAKGGNGNGKNQTEDSDTSTTTATTETAVQSTTIELLDRKRPLETDETVTAVIGSSGGWLWIPNQMEVEIPPKALSQDVKITLTALAGSKVAFELQPHGLQFNRPVRLSIATKLGDTDQDLFAVYFDGDPTAAVALELFSVWMNPSWAEFETTHFSGYALASGSRKSRSLDNSF